MTCITCGSEISKERLLAVPATTVCTACRSTDDVQPTKGFTTYTGKHGRELILSTEVSEEAFRWLRRNDRKGNHAQLPFSNHDKNSPTAIRVESGTAEFDSIRTEARPDSPFERLANFVPCMRHPERPALAQRMCGECCQQWYARRIVR